MSARVLRWSGPLLAAVALSCGADNKEAPTPAPKLAGCRGVEQLMPRFIAAANTGKTEGLKQVIRDYLLVPAREGDPPPVADALRAGFSVLSTWAKLPPEIGAAPGETCNAVAPPLSDVPPPTGPHPLCELRRSLDLLVHDAKGLEAVKLVDPQVAGILNYILGRPPASQVPHYELSGVIAKMCQPSAVCDLGDGLDLVVGLTAFAETPEGQAALDRIDVLLENPALAPYFTAQGEQFGGENGVVALTRLLLEILPDMSDPAELDALPIGQLPASLQPDLNAVLGDMKRLLDPKREPNVLRPLKKAVGCYATSDTNLELVRMLYRLTFDAKLPAFETKQLLSRVNLLRATDQRGTVLRFVRSYASAVRRDEQALSSMSKVCSELFSTQTGPGRPKTNAELAVPVVADLFSQGIVNEIACATDTLIYGCTGGPQPACQP